METTETLPPTPDSRGLWAAKTLFVLCLVLLAAFYLVTAREMFPPPFTDSAPHLIPTINYKAGHGFGGVYWELTRTYDPTGQHRFLQYPPLFHLAMARLMRQPTVEAAYACLGGFSVVALGLCAALMWRRDRASGARKPVWVLLAALGLWAMSTWLCLGPAAGRPESLTTPLILLSVLVFQWARPSWRPVVAGVFIGLVAATQIVNAVLLGLMYSVYASLPGAAEGRPAMRWCQQAAVAATLGVLVFVGCLALGPHPVGETLRGIVVHAQRLASIRYAVVVNYLSPSVNGSFFGLFFAAILAGFLRLERHRLKMLVLLNLGLLLIAVWYFAIRASDLSYNVFAFTPMLAALAMQSLARLDAGASADWTRSRRTAYSLGFAVFGLMSIGGLRQGLAFALYKAYGVSYAEAKRHFTELVPPDQPTPVYMATSLWPLASRLDHLYLDQRTKHPPGYTPETARPWLVLHQWYDRYPVPPEIPGYQLTWNDFIDHPTPRVLGFRVSTTTPGYAFALYKPVEP